MKTKKRAVFIWDFTVNPLEVHGWGDGLSAALQILNGTHGYETIVIPSTNVDEIYAAIETHDPDVIIGWGSLDRPSFAGLKKFGKPTALCFAGGPTEHSHLDNFDIIFCENESYAKAFKEQGKVVRVAFGTSHDLFQPMVLRKHFDTIYPASFANWKRHNIYSEAVGTNGLAVGKILPKEKSNYDICVMNGTAVLPMVPYDVLPYLYAQSRVCVITSFAGSQRTVLEAMAMNIPIVLTEDNEKSTEILKESGLGFLVKPEIEDIRKAVKKAIKVAPEYAESGKSRDFIMEHYSADRYAKTLFEGLELIQE